MKKDLSYMRQDYQKGSAHEDNFGSSPLLAFEMWFQEALASDQPEPNAFTLATVDADGQPSLRVVLMKEYNAQGFVFFTNYESHKSQAMATHPQVAMNFFWHSLERQVRVEGRVEKISEADSLAYFRTRDRGSRIGAWASPQSHKIESREVLEARVQEFAAKFEGLEEIPLPPHWGGFLIIPHKIEFWQGRSNRLHDRIVFEREGDSWAKYRVAP